MPLVDNDPVSGVIMSTLGMMLDRFGFIAGMGDIIYFLYRG
jgi:hypothetical protein